jgi:hypothetical protein
VTWTYFHTAVNHFPIVLTVVGSAVLALALITGRRAVWLYALATLTLAGVSIYPTFFSGNAASHAQRDTWYIVRSTVEEHDASAGWALWIVLLMGAASAYMWRWMLRRDVSGLPPAWMRVVVAFLAALGLSVVVRTAYLGGEIVHGSPKLLNPPTGAASRAP